MKELTDRLRALRATAKIDDAFDARLRAAEFKSHSCQVEFGFAKF